MPSAFWIWRVVTFFGVAWVSSAVVASGRLRVVGGERGAWLTASTRGQRQRQRREAAYVR